MLVTQEKATVTGDLAFSERVGMQFDPSAMAMQVRNAIRMYANPRKAALREYTSNAKDAHKAAGHTGPVMVTLPSSLHPFLTIQDKGVGLDREELKGYGQFGHTTKDKSNDYIGGFGLGSKSGLAVAQQFTVIAIKDGKKNVVVVGWDETGLPSLGFLDEQDTDESNGVTIQIPSAQGHSDWADVVAGSMFIGWERGSIIINGKEPVKSVHDTTQFQRINGGWLTLGERSGGRYYYGGGETHALVHGVYYSIPNEKFHDRDMGHILNGSVLDIPNGAVDILPSRDDLEWTDRTVKAVRDVANTMVKAIVAEYEKQIKAAKSFLEAKEIADRMDEIALPTKGLTFDGILLDWTKETSHVLTTGQVKSSNSAKTGWATDRTASQTNSLADVHKQYSILVTDLTGETKAGYYRKDMKFIDESSDTVPFLTSVAARTGESITKLRVFYTNEPVDALPKGFVLAMREVVTPDKFAEAVTAQRKAWAKDRATAASPRVKAVDRQLRTVSSFSNWNYAFSVYERSEQKIIAEGKKVLVLHAEDALALTVLEAHTSSSATHAVASLMKFISSRASATDTVVVLLAKNHKASNLAIQGWVNLSDWLRAELAHLPVLTSMEVAAREYRRNRPGYGMIPKLSVESIAKIKDATMREWMTAYVAPDVDVTIQGEVAQAYPQFAPAQPVAKDYKPWELYPLAPRVGLDRDEAHLLVDYINLVDSARKGR